MKAFYSDKGRVKRDFYRRGSLCKYDTRIVTLIYSTPTPIHIVVLVVATVAFLFFLPGSLVRLEFWIYERLLLRSVKILFVYHITCTVTSLLPDKVL